MPIFRVINLLHLSEMKHETFWTIVKEVRKFFILQNNKPRCGYTFMRDEVISSSVDRLENRIGLNQTISHYPIDNIDQKTLETGAKMFIYLNVCPTKESVFNKRVTLHCP